MLVGAVVCDVIITAQHVDHSRALPSTGHDLKCYRRRPGDVPEEAASKTCVTWWCGALADYPNACLSHRQPHVSLPWPWCMQCFAKGLGVFYSSPSRIRRMWTHSLLALVVKPAACSTLSNPHINYCSWGNLRVEAKEQTEQCHCMVAFRRQRQWPRKLLILKCCCFGICEWIKV